MDVQSAQSRGSRSEAHTVRIFSPDHPCWSAYVAHLKRANMARWAVTAGGAPLEGCHYLGMMGVLGIAGQAGETDETGAAGVVGHLSLKLQPIVLPALDTAPEPAPITTPAGAPLIETFVQTFAVDEMHRRQGYGRALQKAALALTASLGACQMRSWSSDGHDANYALKVSLGFGIHPAVIEPGNGQKVRGAYFVKAVWDERSR